MPFPLSQSGGSTKSGGSLRGVCHRSQQEIQGSPEAEWFPTAPPDRWATSGKDRKRPIRTAADRISRGTKSASECQSFFSTQSIGQVVLEQHKQPRQHGGEEQRSQKRLDTPPATDTRVRSMITGTRDVNHHSAAATLGHWAITLLWRGPPYSTVTLPAGAAGLAEHSRPAGHPGQ